MMKTSLHRATRLLAVGTAAAFVLAACGDDPAAPTDPGAGNGGDDTAAAEDQTVTIYSGRNEELVGPLLRQIEDETGVTVEVRYGDTAEMAAQILEEGDASPADVFFGQDAGALGALSNAGRLAPLDAEVTDGVIDSYVAPDETWTATSARARVIAYDPDQVSEDELPQSLDDLLDPRWEGQIGYPPSNASWQTFVTAVRLDRGEDGAREFLEAFDAQNPQRFENNNATLDGVDAGQVQLGLINHYYIYPRFEELGMDGVNARIHYVGGGDPLGLVNVAGGGVVNTSDNMEAAQQVMAFLASETAQTYFTDETAEYAVREGITSSVHDLPPIDELDQPDIELAELESLEETLALLQETGLA